jgi:hypothetical protein
MTTADRAKGVADDSLTMDEARSVATVMARLQELLRERWQ